MPLKKDMDKPYKHEDYLAAIIELMLKDTIEDHPLNKDRIKAYTVANFLKGIPTLGRELLLIREPLLVLCR